MRRTPFRALSIVALTLLLAAGTAGVTSADTGAGEHGDVGVHRLRDVFGYPGVRCFYEGEKSVEQLVGIEIRTPVVFARDTSPGVDIQRVGWRSRVQQLVGATWKTVLTGPLERTNATDQHPAEFTQQAFDIPAGRYRVFVQMFWYEFGGPTGSPVVGRATRRVDHYAIVVNGDQAFEQDSSCPG